MTELDETLKEFLVESFENLEQLDRELLALEEDPSNHSTINTIFRIIHTIKGTSGFFDFKILERVSHVGENLLDSLRSQAISVTPEIVTALLELNDTLRGLLSRIIDEGNEGTETFSGLIERLTKLNTKKADTSPTTTASTSKSEVDSTAKAPDTALNAANSKPVEASIDDLDALFQQAQAEYSKQSPDTHSATPIAKSSAEADKAKEESGNDTKKHSEISDSSLRVDVNLLDKLMNLVGELVLARNQILQFTKTQNDGEFVNTSQRLNLITSELQDGVMRTRMQPVSTIWNKLPRIVRDISQNCGKQVNLEMIGKDTDLDRAIIEAMKDPLTHIIRNAVDHGIESPDSRKKAGKSPTGTLTLKAFHEGGQVIIQISDDGAGLHTERIRKKALEKGIITPENAASLSEADIYRLIFLPGFSTAEKITNISGRGVGMDVVRSNIERIGGAVDVTSSLGTGTTFTIKIPLTLAIIPALIVACGGSRYAIPQVNLHELVRVENPRENKNIERVQGAEFYRLRGKLLPLVYLDAQLNTASIRAQDSTALNIVVVKAENGQFGLVVDTIQDTEEIVVKPLGRLLKSVPVFAGATIMGDGQVALILDVLGLGRAAQLTKRESISKSQEKAGKSATEEPRSKLLVFQLCNGRRAAIPLEDVSRLEEFPIEKVEQAGTYSAVQYRDGILPLIDLSTLVHGTQSAYEKEVKAFVHQGSGVQVGFVVEEILDIVEQSVKLETPFQRPGILGSAVIQNKVTDIIDLQAALKISNLSPTESGRGASL
jgi:two-component system chemotaxis sensor kinase CheA